MLGQRWVWYGRGCRLLQGCDRTVASCCPTMHRICPRLPCPPPASPDLAQCSEAPYPGPGPMWVRKTCPDSHWIITRRGGSAFSCPCGCCPLSFTAVGLWVSLPSPSPQAGFCGPSTRQGAFWAWSRHFCSLPSIPLRSHLSPVVLNATRLWETAHFAGG